MSGVFHQTQASIAQTCLRKQTLNHQSELLLPTCSSSTDAPQQWRNVLRRMRNPLQWAFELARAVRRRSAGLMTIAILLKTQKCYSNQDRPLCRTIRINSITLPRQIPKYSASSQMESSTGPTSQHTRMTISDIGNHVRAASQLEMKMSLPLKKHGTRTIEGRGAFRLV